MSPFQTPQAASIPDRSDISQFNITLKPKKKFPDTGGRTEESCQTFQEELTPVLCILLEYKRDHSSFFKPALA